MEISKSNQENQQLAKSSKPALEILETSAKDDLSIRYYGLTITEAAGGMKMFQMTKRYGFGRLYNVVKMLIMDANNYFNVKGMDAGQIADTAQIIIETHTHISIEDLILCFKLGKSGKYGTMYNRIDGGILLEWIAKYEVLKAENLENEWIKIKHEEKIGKSHMTDMQDIYKDFEARQKQFQADEAEKRRKETQEKIKLMREKGQL